LAQLNAAGDANLSHDELLYSPRSFDWTRTLMTPHRLLTEIAPLNLPFVVGLDQNRADKSDHDVRIGKDTDDFRPSLHFAVEPFERIGTSLQVQESCGKAIYPNTSSATPSSTSIALFQQPHRVMDAFVRKAANAGREWVKQYIP
jgi:hypothetical protein